MENMKNCVIIIESPNKCEKIEQYSGAKTHATKGHFMELDQEYIDFSNYEPKFIMMESKKKQISFIAGQCKDKVVYIATDPDREGYVIGHNFYELIKNTAKSIKRAEFHEITKAGIEKGLKEAKDFSTTNKNLYEAGKARTVGDKMTGYIMSPKIGERFGVYKNNSVGRVQTPALALLVKREQEIIQYDKQPREQRLSYKILCEVLDKDNKTYITTNSNIFNDKEEAQSFIDSIANISEAIVKTIESKDNKKAPPKPYQATTLIKDANKTYGFDSKKTMDIAQELFEKGLITYHRTDSEAISIDFIEQIEKRWY